MSIRNLNWHALNRPELDLYDLISSKITEMEIAGIVSIPDLRASPAIYIASDYGGSHNKGAGQQIYSFLIVDEDAMTAWLEATVAIREILKVQDRSISYKDLGDSIGAKLVEPFLTVANDLNGILVSIGIDNRIKYLAPDARDNDKPPQFSTWKQPTYERMLRVAHTLNLIVAGLSREAQNVYWLSDHDDIVTNESRATATVDAVKRISSKYVSYRLGDFIASDTLQYKHQSSKLVAEDFAALPDLAAGALCDFVGGNSPEEPPAVPGMVSLLKQPLAPKSKLVIDWLCDESQKLKRLFIEIGPSDEPGQHIVYCRQIVKLPRTGRIQRVLALRPEAYRPALWLPSYIRIRD
jgi:hypothetical protein